MTELKCPFCDKPLQPTHRIEDEYFCENYDCPQTSLTWIGTSSLWKALANTKKKLDMCEGALEEYKDWFNKSQERLKIAVEELTKIKTAAESVGIGFFMTAAISALAKIKNAEQIKDNDKDTK